MNSAERTVAAATRAYADIVRQIRPLELTPRAPRARRSITWMAPVTAAAAVIALAISLVIVRGIPNGHTVPPVAPLTASGSHPAGVPAYYVALDNTLDSSAPFLAVVVNTFTGRRLATVKPPAHSTFAGVTAAADDRTFVLDATTCSKNTASSRLCPRTWYLLRLSSRSASVARLTRLPVPATASGSQVQGMALSLDGSELAVALHLAGKGILETLTIYSVATGAVLHTWTGPRDTILDPYGGSRIDGDATLFWSADGRTLVLRNETALRTLNTSAPGHDLIADSRVAWNWRAEPNPNWKSHGYQLTCFNAPFAAPDGTTFVCGASGVPTSSVRIRSKCSAMWDNTRGYLEYAPGGPARARYVNQTTCTAEVTAEVLWASASGKTIIGWLNSAPVSDPGGPQANTVGVITGGRITAIPFPLNGGAAIPDQVAW